LRDALQRRHLLVAQPQRLSSGRHARPPSESGMNLV